MTGPTQPGLRRVWTWAVPVAVLAACALGALGAPTVARALDRLQYDAWYRSWRPVPPVDPRVVPVLLDDRSLDRLGGLPLPRHHLATFTEGVATAGGRGVVVDLLFARPTDDDDALAAAMGRVPTAVAMAAGTTLRPSGTAGPVLDSHALAVAPEARRLLPALAPDVLPVPAIAGAATLVAHVAAGTDDDGVSRRVAVVADVDGRAVPSLGLAAAMFALGVPADDVAVLDGPILRLGAHGPDPIDVPLAPDGTLWVNRVDAWRDDLDVRSFVQQLAPDPADPPPWVRALADRVALVGAGYTGSGDTAVTPLEQARPGVIVWWDVANTVLTGTFLVPAPTWLSPLLAVGLAFLPAPLFRAHRPALGLVTALFGAVAVVAASAAWFAAAGVYLPAILPATAAVASGVGLAVIGAFAEGEARANHLAAGLARIASPALLAEVLATPPGTRPPPPARHEVTALFVDLAGFTRFSREHEPEEVSALLAAFYDLAFRAIEAEGGTLEKFMGDGVLAYFGAPEPHPDRASRAVRAALALCRGFADLDAARVAQGEVSLALRCGLATGHVHVGYFGSDRHGTWGAIGRAVNLASRLQGIAGPMELVLDQRTAARAPEAALGVPEEAVVKGFDQPVQVVRLPSPEARCVR